MVIIFYKCILVECLSIKGRNYISEGELVVIWVYRATKEYAGAKFVLVVDATDLPGNTSTTSMEGEV